MDLKKGQKTPFFVFFLVFLDPPDGRKKTLTCDLTAEGKNLTPPKKKAGRWQNGQKWWKIKLHK